MSMCGMLIMKLIDLSNYLYQELGEPTTPTITDITFILRNLVGELNNLISTEYCIVDQDYCPELGESEAAILGNLYLLRYYNKMINNNLGASAYNWNELREGDSVIRKVSNNEISKTYLQLKNTISEYIKFLVSSYKQNQCVPTGYSHDYCGCFSVTKYTKC